MKYTIEVPPDPHIDRGGFIMRRWGYRAVHSMLPMSVLLVLALLARWIGLSGNPGWDMDEGYNLSMVANLLEGRWQMLAVYQTFVQHPPLYYIFGALLFPWVPHTISGLRVVSALLGAVAVVPVYLLALELSSSSRRAAFLAALTYAVGTVSVENTRMAYTYVLLVPLLPTMVLAFLRWERGSIDRTPYWVAVLMGALLLADRVAIAPVMVTLVWVWRRSRRLGVAARVVLLAIVPSLGYILPALLLRPHLFLFDLLHTGERLGDTGSPLVHAIRVLIIYGNLQHLDPLIFSLGCLGLLLLLTRQGGPYTFVVFFSTALLSFWLRDPRAYFRQAIPLLPFLYVGLGALLDMIIGSIWVRFRRTTLFALATLLLLLPLLVDAIDMALSVEGEFHGPTTPTYAVSEVDVRRSAEIINNLTHVDDLVIADAYFSGVVESRVADWAQAGAATGKGAAFYPPGMPKEQFAYDISLNTARVAVVDRFVEEWAQEEPGSVVSSLLQRVTTRWILYTRVGPFSIYLNPTT